MSKRIEILSTLILTIIVMVGIYNSYIFLQKELKFKKYQDCMMNLDLSNKYCINYLK